MMYWVPFGFETRSMTQCERETCPSGTRMKQPDSRPRVTFSSKGRVKAFPRSGPDSTMILATFNVRPQSISTEPRSRTLSNEPILTAQGPSQKLRELVGAHGWKKKPMPTPLAARAAHEHREAEDEEDVPQDGANDRA